MGIERILGSEREKKTKREEEIVVSGGKLGLMLY